MMSKYPTTKIVTTVEDLSWLAGTWIGEKDGALIEEQWSAPAGNAMMCMFRWVEQGQARFYEFVTIEGDPNGLTLRIKHFNPGLLGWEEKDESIAFSLVQLEDRKAVFFKEEGEAPLWMIYQRIEEDTLLAWFESTASKPAEGEFIFRRR
jgi:hypothetical protein